MTEIVHTFSYKDITNFISLWSRSFNLFSYIFNCIVSFYSRVRIIGSHFANCEVNSSYCNCKVVNGTKIAKQFFSQGKFSLSKLYFPHHILVLFIHCILLSKEIMLILKITRVKSLATLGIFITKWISNDNSSAVQWNLFSMKQACTAI